MAAHPQSPVVFVAQQPARVQTVSSAQQQFVASSQQSQVPKTAMKDKLQRNKSVLHGLGLAEIALGVFSVLLGISIIIVTPSEVDRERQRLDLQHYLSDDYVDTVLSYTSQGIWSGIFMITVGFLGTRAKKSPSRSMYIANMIMTIITAIIEATGIVMSSCAAAVSRYSIGVMVMHSTLSILCLIGMVMVIVHSAYCCGGICCIRKASSPKVVYVTPHGSPYPQSQYVQGPDGQIIMVLTQPPMQNVVKPQQFQYPHSPPIIHSPQSPAPQRPDARNQKPAEANYYAEAADLPIPESAKV